jgi:hypothetical protein
MMMNVEKIDEEGEGGSLKKQTAAATGQADEYFWRFMINELRTQDSKSEKIGKLTKRLDESEVERSILETRPAVKKSDRGPNAKVSARASLKSVRKFYHRSNVTIGKGAGS